MLKVELGNSGESMSKAGPLYDLQSLDHQISARRARLREIDAALGDDLPIRKAEQRLAKAKADLTPWQTRVTDLDLEVKGLDDKAGAAEKRLYSGAVTNPKQLQDMQEEVASLKRRRAALEEGLLEAMIQVEAHTEAQQEAQSRLEKIKKRWASEQAALKAEKRTLEAELESLAARRAATWNALDPDSQAAYQALWDRTQGQPVATLDKEGNCSRCGVTQNTAVAQRARRGDTLEHCEGCGRILAVR